MPHKAQVPESLPELKERLRQLESVEMIGPDDLILLEQKQTLRAKIDKAESQLSAVPIAPLKSLG